MPCYDGQSSYEQEKARQARAENPLYYAKEDAIKAINALDKVMATVVGRNHELANMLCRVLNLIDGQETYDIRFFGEDIAKWWEEHKKFDEQRASK